MANKQALVSPETQALIQTVLSSSLVTHHFEACPRFRQLFLEHLRQCPLHREEMDGLRARAIQWAGDVRRKLFGW